MSDTLKLALRHSQLCRRGACAGAGGLQGDRPVSARLWYDALSFKRHLPECPAVGGRCRYHRVDGCTQDREGEPHYDELEQRLAQGPDITVPTMTLEGDANGAPHPDASAYARKFSGRYAHRVITGGVGHNLPQEASQAFAQAIIDVDA